MITAFVFPGQGSQFPGMGKDLFNEYTVVREIYNKANRIAGFRIDEISFDADKATLAQTQYTQPCIFTHSYAVLNIIDKKFELTAGHSLGEYSSLVAAKSITFDDGLMAVVERGRLMAQAKEGGMIAPLGLSIENVKDVVNSLKPRGVIEIANYNSPKQFIISGEKQLLSKASEILKEKGAKRVVPLNVSGAFHSSLMLEAQKEMKKVLAKIKFNEPNVNFYSNVTGTLLTDPTEIRNNLVLQLTKPVRWINIIENMIKDDAEEFIEIGPGKVLQGLIKKINPLVETLSWETL